MYMDFTSPTRFRRLVFKVELSDFVNNGFSSHQWNRFHGARGHVPPLLQMAGHGGHHE